MFQKNLLTTFSPLPIRIWYILEQENDQVLLVVLRGRPNRSSKITIDEVKTTVIDQSKKLRDHLNKIRQFADNKIINKLLI